MSVDSGDELVGLTRAFFYAGTPSVVSTLWSVDDESSALLMKHFYTYLHDGMGKADALRQAQFDVRKQYPNPYYWAGYVLLGDGGVIATSGSSWAWPDWAILAIVLPLAIIGVLLIGVLLVWRGKRRHRPI